MIIYTVIIASLLGLSACCPQKHKEQYPQQPQQTQDVVTQAFEDDTDAKEIGISDDEDLFIDDMQTDDLQSQESVEAQHLVEVVDLTDKSMDEEFPEISFEQAISITEFE